MVRYQPWRTIRNAFHYACDYLDITTPFSGTFSLGYCTSHQGAVVTDGRLKLVGDGVNYPHVIIPLPERAKDQPHSRANKNIFTTQAHICFAENPADVEEVPGAGESLRMYILDQFMDRNNPIGFIQVTALVRAGNVQNATVQCEAMDNGSYNVDTYGGTYQIWGNTALFTPVTIELRLDMTGQDRYRLNYTLAHCLGNPAAWAAVESDMFELMAAGELDCDNRRPAYVMFELVDEKGELPDHDLAVPGEGDVACIWGIHFAEDPFVAIGADGTNIIDLSLGIANAVTGFPHVPGQYIPQPMISHGINGAMLLSNSGTGDALIDRYLDMTYSQGYRNLVIGPIIENDDHLGGDYDGFYLTLKANLLVMFEECRSRFDRVVVCGVLPRGDLAHAGLARVAERRRCFTGLNRWMAQVCKDLNFSFVDMHSLLRYSDSENTTNYDFYGFTPPGTAWSSTGLYPDSPVGIGMVGRAVRARLDRP